MKKQTRKNSRKARPVSYWNSLDHTLTTLEKQAEKVYTQFKHALPRSVEKKLDQLTHRDIIKMALQKRRQITKEVKYFADEIITRLNNADFLSDKTGLVKKARYNLEEVLHKLQNSGVVTQVKNLASEKGSQIFSLLNFPTKNEVTRLNARLSQLEKRLKGLKRTSAASGR